MKTVTWEIDDSGVVHLTLNRPKVHNAFNDELITELTASLKTVAGEERIRALVLSGKGKSFSAGADLNWMKTRPITALKKIRRTLPDWQPCCIP